jgi:hypothetical protein
MTFTNGLIHPNLATADHRNVVKTASIEDHSLARWGCFGHDCVRFTDVLYGRAARACQKMSAHFFALVVLTEFIELVFENDECFFELL